MADNRVAASVGERLARRIAETGPIPASEYVRACLYDRCDGFYMRPSGGRAGGRSGHFLTAPEVGPLFGAVLARALDAWWAELGEPEPFTVIDWGAGPGTLARAVLAAEPRCMSAGALRLVLLEVSPAQRAQHPAHRLVTSSASVDDALPGGADAGVVVANELLDNLPFDIVRRTADGWEELLVCLDSTPSGSEAAPRDAAPCAPGQGTSFGLIARPAARGLVEGLPDAAVGARVPVQQAARRWVAEANRVLREGWIVAFDYGADTAELALFSATTDERRAAEHAEPHNRSAAGRSAVDGLDERRAVKGSAADGLADGRSAVDGAADGRSAGVSAVDGLLAAAATGDDLAAGLGWLRTHRHHDRGSSWLRDPGSCDVTADVAMDQVQADHRAEVGTQADFLRAHGIDELVWEGRTVWAERAGVGDLKALAARSRAREAEALLDPEGMGGFKTLLWPVGRRP